MERKVAIKMEDLIRSPLFHDHFPADKMFDDLLSTTPNEGDKNSLGFMELLGIQEFSPSILDVLQFNSTSSPPPLPSSVVDPFRPSTQTSAVLLLPESSVDPTTPNSSISSASSGVAATDEQSKAAANHEEEDEQQKTTKRLKVKRTSLQKRREREPRFAFLTRSEVDHLEDGYRWRKYGQKAVKNSPFPRSYYRCTNASCNVKKRVERCLVDPTIVVTTYEGKHTHPSPLMHRPTTSAAAALRPAAALNAADPFQPQVTVPPQSQFMSILPPFMNCGNYTSNLNPTSSALLTVVDHGLLQDILPSPMRKE